MKIKYLILLFFFSSVLINAENLAGGITLGETDYLIFSEKTSIILKTLAMDTFREYKHVVAFDYYNNTLMIVTSNVVLIMSNNLETHKINLSEINPICMISKHPIHFKMISKSFVLIPERTPYFLNISKEPYMAITNEGISNLYYLNEKTITLFNMRNTLETESFFGFLNEKQFSVFSKMSGNLFLSAYQDFQSLTELSENGTTLTAIFDNHWKITFSLEKKTAIERIKLESKDTLEKSISLKNLSSPLTVTLRPSSTSIFSILADWKKGESSADISLTLSGKTVLQEKVTFSMKNMEDFSGEITHTGNYIIIYLPEKTHIIRQTQNVFKLSSFNLGIPLAIMNNKCFVQINNVITEIDSQCPNIHKK